MQETPLFQSATDAAQAVRRKELSSRELTEMLLARIEAVNPPLNAVVELSVPYERGDVLAALHREGEVLVEVHDDHATRVRARLPRGGIDRFREFLAS